MKYNNIFYEFGFWIDQDGTILPFCFFKGNKKISILLNQINQVSSYYSQLNLTIEKIKSILKREIVEYEFSTNMVDFNVNEEVTYIENYLAEEARFSVLTKDFLLILENKRNFINSFSERGVDDLIKESLQIINIDNNIDETNSLSTYLHGYYFRFGIKDKSQFKIKGDLFNFSHKTESKFSIENRRRKYLEVTLIKELNIISNYIFFDGVEEHQVINSYDNWLSSSEYSVYTKSYIKSDDIQVNLFGPKTKKIEEFYLQNGELFNELNQKLNFEIKVKGSNGYTIYYSKKKYEDYYVTHSEFDDKNYIIFYSLGGSKFVESITIHGVFISFANTNL